MHYFNSKAINAASYDPETGTLAIRFTSSGKSFDYYSVPPNIWQGFLSATSAGTYFNQFIRDQYAA